MQRRIIDTSVGQRRIHCGISCHYEGGDLMIDAKQAVQIAKQKAEDILNLNSSALEEIESESYKDREVWSITLGLPRDLTPLHPLAQLSSDTMQYKRFLTDV